MDCSPCTFAETCNFMGKYTRQTKVSSLSKPRNGFLGDWLSPSLKPSDVETEFTSVEPWIASLGARERIAAFRLKVSDHLETRTGGMGDSGVCPAT
jgi:hypothetical protein